MTADGIDLGYRKVSRSAYAHDTARPLSIYLGVCDQHSRPVRHEGEPLARQGTGYLVTCPEDGGHPIQAERLVAVTTNVSCDGSCMSARRPSCDCGCGGMNHGKSWGTTVTRQEYESALTTYRAEKVKIEAKREQRAEAKERKARQTFEAWAADHAELVQALEAHKPGDFGEPQPGSNSFLCSLAGQVSGGKALSENQVAAAHRVLEQARKRELELAARKAAAKPVPVGKVQVSGRIVKVTCREGYMPDSIEMKATVACDGYAVWVSLPRKVEDWALDNRREQIWRDYDRPRFSYSTDYQGASDRWTDALKGVQLTFTADVTRSDRDESFGFAKRPTKVTFQLPKIEEEIQHG